MRASFDAIFRCIPMRRDSDDGTVSFINLRLWNEWSITRTNWGMLP